MKHLMLSLFLLFSLNLSYAANPISEKIATNLRNPLFYYPDFVGKTVKKDQNVLSLEIPKRAEDAAFVPLRINTKNSQKELFIKKIWVFVDENPLPLTAIFEFGKASEQANLAFKIRVDGNSFVRAIALTEKNELYQASRFVKASGGCSAPPGADIAEGRKHLGEMRMSSEANSSRIDSTLVNLKIRHLNLTGLQTNQVTRLRELPHYVKHIKVSLGDDIVFTAETTFSISENPNFRFYVLNSKNNNLKIEVEDTKGSEFTNDFTL